MKSSWPHALGLLVIMRVIAFVLTYFACPTGHGRRLQGSESSLSRSQVAKPRMRPNVGASNSEMWSDGRAGSRRVRKVSATLANLFQSLNPAAASIGARSHTFSSTWTHRSHQRDRNLSSALHAGIHDFGAAQRFRGGASSSDDNNETGDSDALEGEEERQDLGEDIVEADVENGDELKDEGTAELEGELVHKITSMISKLIQDLERPPSEEAEADTSDDESNSPPSTPPIHFRVFRGPPGGVPIFPGFPGGKLPFPLPGAAGGDEEEDGEVSILARRLEAAHLPQEAEEVALRELKRLRRMSPMHSEYSTLIEYLEFMADLPWANASVDSLNISAAREQLEADHFGMEKVKSRIMEYLSVCKLKGDIRGSIMCLHGPPGIGKTSLGRSVADALNRKFYRISLGGVHGEGEVRGHRRTYVGAMPGLILQALKKCGTNNCVIMLDEIDKLGRESLNGDPSSALLEVLDPEQNQAFRDHFLNLPFNLSRVLFIATANELEPIPRPLRDRMEVIEMSGYTVEEKIQIASKHLLPKQRGYHGLVESDLDIERPAVDTLISRYTREAGVRELDRQLAALCRNVAARSAEALEAREAAALREVPEVADDSSTGEPVDGDSSGQVGLHSDAADSSSKGGMLGAEDLIHILGPPKFDGPRDSMHRVRKPGIAVGLAYTPVGGDVLFVEAETMAGKGDLAITGQLGDVMVESVRIAMAWVRAHAGELRIPLGSGSSDGLLLNGTDLHIHVPAGAMPKDGPSAGVTIATAIVSLLTGRTVRPDLAMTGELSLRGVVLPVGGIKEKLIAAHRAGMTHVIIPAKNEKDLRDLPKSVLAEINVTFVDDIEEVLVTALQPLQDIDVVSSQPLPPGPSGPGEHSKDQRGGFKQSSYGRRPCGNYRR